MKDIKKIISLLFFLLFSSSLTAQTVIKGMVTNAKTGKPLPGTNVYLAKTTIGNSTNGEGRYLIKTGVKGNFNLVFSFIGFKKKVVPVILAGDTVININATLAPKTLRMEEITVTRSNKRWQARFNFFRKEFIGETSFAEKTIIKNPEVLRFAINAEGRFVASAVKPLQVINRALGYKIYVELHRFEYTRDGRRGFYLIYPKYEPLEPDSKEQQERWQENREEAYLGSLRHFLKSLYYDNVSDNFSVTPGGNVQSLTKTETTFALLGRVPMKFIESLKGFKVFAPTVVVYGNFSDKERSAIASNTEDEVFFINRSGILLNPLSIRLGGYWSSLRMAAALPLDYELDS